jgi:hypothetical protein
VIPAQPHADDVTEACTLVAEGDRETAEESRLVPDPGPKDPDLSLGALFGSRHVASVDVS